MLEKLDTLGTVVALAIYISSSLVFFQARRQAPVKEKKREGPS